MECNEYIKVDWDNTIENQCILENLLNSCRCNPCCNNLNCCKNMNCCINNYKIMYFVFKQQVYYVKKINNMNVNWIPLVVSNGQSYISGEHYSQYSTNLSQPVQESIVLPSSPVVYPDYSKTDVGQGKQWPAKVFSPFVDSTAYPSYKIADEFTVTRVPFYNLGFIVSENPNLCKPSWGGYYPAEAGPLNDQIKALRQLGGDVTVSFGGAANVPLHVTAPDEVSLFMQYKLFADAYGLTRIDFDIEGIWVDPAYEASLVRNSKALKMLQDDFKKRGKSIAVWFTLPILPTGLVVSGLNILKLALNAGVEIGGVNAMAMDYGDGAAPDPAGKMGQYGIQAITALKNQLNVLYNGTKTEAQLWSMIGITPMLGINDVEDEVFKQSDAREVLTFAQTNNIGMISMWSSNRDNSAMSRIPQTNNEFAMIFNAYNII